MAPGTSHFTLSSWSMHTPQKYVSRCGMLQYLPPLQHSENFREPQCGSLSSLNKSNKRAQLTQEHTVGGQLGEVFRFSGLTQSLVGWHSVPRSPATEPSFSLQLCRLAVKREQEATGIKVLCSERLRTGHQGVLTR